MTYLFNRKLKLVNNYIISLIEARDCQLIMLQLNAVKNNFRILIKFIQHNLIRVHIIQ